MDANTLFFRHVDSEPFLDPVTDRDKSRPAKGSKARIKWLGGDSETGPWVYYIEHAAGARIRPHKHLVPRIEYVLEGDIRFYEGEEALAWIRGGDVEGSAHGPGTMSYVPSGTLYAYEIVTPARLLHVFYDNPVGRTVHADREDQAAASEAAG